MAEIINLGELVPEDILFVYGEKEFVLPGDLDTETVFKIFAYFRDVMQLRVDGDEKVRQADLIAASNKLHDLLLGIFQQRNPDLEGPLPFGARSLPIITEKILGRLGIGTEGPLPEDDEHPTVPASPSPKKKPRSSATRRPSGTSPRSRGSQSS